MTTPLAAPHQGRARVGSRMMMATAALLLLLLSFLLSWPIPFAIAFSVSTLWLITTAMAIVRRPRIQNALVALASFSFSVAAGEVGPFLLNNAGPHVTDTLEYSMDDPNLGYRPRPDRHVHARETYGHKILFDVTYTIDANGFRVIPTPVTAAP